MQCIAKRLLFVSAASLLSVATAYGQAINDSDDRGGNLQAYLADVERLNRQGLGKRIIGLCASACTVYLGVRNVCIEPSAQVWFHAAHHPGSRQPDPVGSLQMLALYPRAVRQWAIKAGALERTEWNPAHRLTGAQLIAMGVRPCR